jgi:hypothetical protein
MPGGLLLCNRGQQRSMKNLILAALLMAVVLCGLAERNSAAMITFTGVVDEVEADVTPTPFAVGDTFSATFTFTYHPHPPFGRGGTVLTYLLDIGNFSLSGTITTGADFVVFDTDPSHGSVLYQLNENSISRPTFSVFSEIDLLASTPSGVIPPIDHFNENVFVLTVEFKNPPVDPPLMQTVTGHLTSLPTITGLSVPDRGASLALLSCSFLTIVTLRRRATSP